MRRSTRRSTMGVSIHSSLDFDSHNNKGITTRRSSSIIPPFQQPSPLVGNFSTKFSMSSFVKKVEELTQDQRNAIERVGFGNLLRIHLHTLRKNLLVEWMDRWNCGKNAFVLGDRELTITAIDVSLILGLRSKGKPVILSEDDPISELEKEYGATSNNRKISISTIEQRLHSLGEVANEDFVRTFLLFIFGTILFPNSSAKIDSRYLLFLKDVDKVSQYAWGMAVVEDLFNWLSKRKEEQTKSMEGCLILLQIWSYEHIDIGRPNQVSSSLNFPRACCWESSRCNTQRQWFSSKFDEHQENQVTWKLQPTATELNIDIIRELVTKEELRGGEEKVKHNREANVVEDSRQSCEVSEIVEDSEEEDIISTRTSTRATYLKMGLSPKELRGGVERVEHNQEANVVEDYRQSCEVLEIVEDSEEEDIISTRTSTRATYRNLGLPPKQRFGRLARLDKEPLRVKVMQSGKHDIQTDMAEDSRQLTDVSVLTEDYTECSSSYALQEDQISNTSHCIKNERVLETEKPKVNDMIQLTKENTVLRKENAVFRNEIASLRSRIIELEEVIAKLSQEVVDLKEDNQRLRAPRDNIENISDLIDEYFAEFSNPPEVSNA